MTTPAPPVRRDRFAGWRPRWTGAARRLGCEETRLAWALRTAVGAWVALLVAAGLGIDHPHWAAMSVWVASQQVRGHLVEKSVFRVLGTLIGSCAAIAVIELCGDSPWWLTVAMALWVSMCTAVGHLSRGFTSYGALLSGYSAAIVALPNAASPHLTTEAGLDRMAAILVGVAVAIVISLRFAVDGDGDRVEREIRTLLADQLSSFAAWCRGGARPSVEERHARLVDYERLDFELDTAVAGDWSSRRRAAVSRTLLGELTARELWWSGAPEVAPAGADAHAERLERCAASVRRGHSASAASAQAQALVAQLVALPSQRSSAAVVPAPVTSRAGVRNWRGAMEASARAAATILVTGAIWSITGVEALSSLTLGVCIMMSLFSTFENPAVLMRWVLAGQFFGGAVAICMQWALWPVVGGELGRLLWTLPFVIVGAVVLTNRRTTRAGFDFIMVGLMVLAPLAPRPTQWGPHIAMATAVAISALVGLIAYRWLLPPRSERQFDQLVADMRREIASMVQTRPSERTTQRWHVAAPHRQLHLVRHGRRAGYHPSHAIRQGESVVAVGQVILGVHDALDQSALPPSSAGTARALLVRLDEQLAAARWGLQLAEDLSNAADDPCLAEFVDPHVLRRAADAVAMAC